MGRRSPARTVCLAWILKKIDTFRTTDRYGRFVLQDYHVFKTQRAQSRTQTNRAHNPRPSALVDFVLKFMFFNVPRIYLDHITEASEWRGRLSSFQANWNAYLYRLVREYSDFLLVVSAHARIIRLVLC